MQIDLSAKSLQKLHEISLENQSNTQAKSLTFDRTSNWYFDEGLRWSRDENGRLEEMQLGAQPLRDILCYRLLHCCSFHIHGDCDDGKEFKSLTPTDVVSLILSIVAQTGIAIKSFVVGVQYGWFCGKRLRPSTFSQCLEFQGAWAHLEELHLYVDLMSDSMSWAKDLMGLATDLRSVL